MRALDIIKMSTRMFKARTSRTLLTILGMGVGIGAILFLVSLGYGLQKTLLEKITTSESLLTLDVTESKSGVVSLNSELIQKIEALAGVKEVSPAIQITSQANLGEISADTAVMGVKPSFLRLGGVTVSQGEAFSDEDQEKVIISSSLVNVFGKSREEIIGKEIAFNFFVPNTDEEVEKNEVLGEKFKEIKSDHRYIVSGIVEGEESLAFVHSETLKNLKIDQFSQAKVRCLANSDMGPIRDKVLEFGLLVSSLSDMVDQANQIFRVIQIVLMLFGIIALVVSAIGMFNTMTIALLERTEEIGIMKSIGAPGGAISLMFIMESTIMGFLGGLGGVVLGYVAGKGFNGLINIVAERLGGNSVTLFYSPVWFVGLIIVFAAVVGFATGFFPARRASKIDPLEALRYK